MNCPNCKEEMEQGLLSDTHNMRWHAKTDKLSFWGSRLFEWNPIGSRKTEAFKCKSCKTVIFKSELNEQNKQNED